MVVVYLCCICICIYIVLHRIGQKSLFAGNFIPHCLRSCPWTRQPPSPIGHWADQTDYSFQIVLQIMTYYSTLYNVIVILQFFYCKKFSFQYNVPLSGTAMTISMQFRTKSQGAVLLTALQSGILGGRTCVSTVGHHPLPFQTNFYAYI